MDDISDIVFKRLHGQLREIVHELTRARFTPFAPPKGWVPAINAYRNRESIVICLELAGVEEQDVEIRAEPRRLQIRGQRRVPDPQHREGQIVQILAMEIDGGEFERIVELPVEVDPERVHAERSNGLLWVTLPLA